MPSIRTYLRQHHVGLLALFVALSGTAYAAVNLPNNSVGSGEIKRNAVKAPEIAKNAVRKAEIRASAVATGEVIDGSLRKVDFAGGQLPAGPPGQSGATNVVMRSGDQASASPDASNESTASCNPGERATGGGFAWTGGSTADFRVIESQPLLSGGVPTAWQVTVSNADANNDNMGSVTFVPRVICASP
jgi:hypothetical protein